MNNDLQGVAAPGAATLSSTAQLPPRRLSVAPMLDWTDRHYRYFARLITKNTWLYTEMVTTGALLHGDVPRHLRYHDAEHPIALQLGGSEPHELAQCARLAAEWGYDEVNLNVGCPSERVQKGAFGACLMAEPQLVADCVKAMRDAVDIDVTVKHRIGIDQTESYDFVRDFDRSAIGAIVLDGRMRGTSGLAVLDALVSQGVDQPVVMLTGHGTVDMCRRAFKAGAAEFLEKPVDDELLIDTLQQAIRRHVRSRDRNLADRAARERFERLSEREREVLGFIVEGLTNKEIGRALQLSPRTVETHRANLFAKLDVESLAQLIRRYAALVESAP